MSQADRSKEPLDWDLEHQKAVTGTRPDAKYGAVSESLRHTIPQATACSLFCGGRKCKYCTSSHWTEHQMVIKGLYSNWVTDNILAMARPTSEGNEQHKFIEQFQNVGIKSIINLQTPGEHAYCGPPLDTSGFSYNPQDYMDNDIFFYNFGWPDYNVGSLSNILDMVKVMQFTLAEGKVAIHCHAGLGRTGVLIGAYLIFANRMDPHEAVHYIRSKRNGAIQTRGQVGCLEEFAKYLKPFRVIFSQKSPQSYEFTLSQYLIRQRHILHGFEARHLKNIPKLMFVVCERLLELAERCRNPGIHGKDTYKLIQETEYLAFNNAPDHTQNLPPTLDNGFYPLTQSHPGSFSGADLTRSSSGSLKGHYHLDTQSAPVPKHGDLSPVMSRRNPPGGPGEGDVDSIGRPSSRFFLGSDPDLRYRPARNQGQNLTTPADHVGAMMAQTEYPMDLVEQVESYKSLLNEDSSTWVSLQQEPDALVLSKLMWDWLDHLKEPLLSIQDLPDMLNRLDDPLVGLNQLDKGTRGTMEYLFRVIARLEPAHEQVEFELVQRCLSVLTHQNVMVDSDLPLGATTSTGLSLLRRTTNLGEMTSSMAMRLTQFSFNLLVVIRNKIRDEEQDRSTGTQDKDRSTGTQDKDRYSTKNKDQYSTKDRTTGTKDQDRYTTGTDDSDLGNKGEEGGSNVKRHGSKKKKKKSSKEY